MWTVPCEDQTTFIINMKTSNWKNENTLILSWFDTYFIVVIMYRFNILLQYKHETLNQNTSHKRVLHLFECFIAIIYWICALLLLLTSRIFLSYLQLPNILRYSSRQKLVTVHYGLINKHTASLYTFCPIKKNYHHFVREQLYIRFLLLNTIYEWNNFILQPLYNYITFLHWLVCYWICVILKELIC